MTIPKSVIVLFLIAVLEIPKIEGGWGWAPPKELRDQPCTLQTDKMNRSPNLYMHIPNCKPDGTFKWRQRNAYMRTCWCVDRYTGIYITETLAPCKEFDIICRKRKKSTTRKSDQNKK